MTHDPAGMEPISPSDPADEVRQKVIDGFQLLAELDTAIERAGGETTREALDRVSGATREVAAIQRLFERRVAR